MGRVNYKGYTREDALISVGSGWAQLINRVFDKLASIKGTVKIVQVKEKFGGLRFYVDGGDEYTNGLIRVAEDASYETCEDCGVPGTLRKGGWWATLCDKCDEERNAQRQNR